MSCICFVQGKDTCVKTGDRASEAGGSEPRRTKRDARIAASQKKERHGCEEAKSDPCAKFGPSSRANAESSDKDGNRKRKIAIALTVILFIISAAIFIFIYISSNIAREIKVSAMLFLIAATLAGVDTIDYFLEKSLEPSHGKTKKLDRVNFWVHCAILGASFFAGVWQCIAAFIYPQLV